jgi:Bacterial membrane protein YfhO
MTAFSVLYAPSGYTSLVPSSRRATALIYISLLANVILFFHKPLFSTAYLFPWDFRSVQLPLLSFLVDRLRAGHFAFWNPYSYCGYPVFANIEACYFQPFILAAAWIAAHTNPERLPQLLEWVVALHIFVAGISAYHLFLNLGAARIPAWAGALIFETGGYFASRAEHIGAIMAVAWMPLAWLAVWKLRAGLDLRWLATLAAALGMAVLGGFPQPTLAVFLSTTVLALGLAVLRMARWTVLVSTAAACLLGLAFSAAIFIPTAQLAQHSVAMYRAGWLGGGGGILPQSFVSLIAPNHYRIFNSDFSGPGDRSFLYLYCSLAGLALAIYAAALRRTRVVALLAAMAVFGALFALGENEPLWRAIYPLLPERVRIGIHPEYCYCIFTLALAGLAALGLDRLRARAAWKAAIGLAIAVDLFVTGSGRPMNLVAIRDEPGVTRDAFGGSRETLATMRGLSFTATPPWRVDNLEGATADWAVQAPLTRVPSANGVSPLALENIIQLRLFLHDGNPWGWYYPVDRLDSPVLDVLNVRYLTASGDGAARVAQHRRFRLAALLPGQQVFENTAVLPRFFLVHEIRPVQSLAEARAAISGGMDFSKTAILDTPLTLAPAAGPENVRAVSYEPDALEIEATASAAGMLVLSENNYPGWHAWLDGAQTPIYSADIAFRGVAVPAGTHRIRMEFRPAILYWSLGLSAATAILLMALALRQSAISARLRPAGEATK